MQKSKPATWASALDGPGSEAFAQIRILATTDLHMHLTSFDYCADRPDPTVGLTRTASLVAGARDEAEISGQTVLLLDNGDALQGTPMGDYAAVCPNDTPHPMMRAFAHLRYDAIGLGNHDFNFGLDFLERILADAPCPVVCTNLRSAKPEKLRHIQHTAILDRYCVPDGALHQLPIRIGVLSVLPPQTLQWDAHLLEGRIEIDDMLEVALRGSECVRAEGCDLVILLAHSGLGRAPNSAASENMVIRLAATGKFDAIVAGHTHRLFPRLTDLCLDKMDEKTGTIHDTPVVMAGASGSHLGVIDLKLRWKSPSGWQVAGHRCNLRPIVQRSGGGQVRELSREAEGLSELLHHDHIRTRNFVKKTIGSIPVALHSYFTFLAQDRSLSFVAAAQAAAIRKLGAQTGTAELPLLSAVAPGRFGGLSGPGAFTDIPAGPVQLRHLFDLQVFPNELCAIVLSGSEILDWLEMAASVFQKIEPGAKGSRLVDLAVPGHAFDVIHGLSYVIDPSHPARFGADGDLRNPESRRVVSAEWQGVAIGPEQEFVVALNSYRASGGGNVAALQTARRLSLPRISIRDLLQYYFEDSARFNALEVFPPAWQFVHMPETVVSVETGPGATQYLDELAGRDVICHGLNERGFLRLSCAL